MSQTMKDNQQDIHGNWQK